MSRIYLAGPEVFHPDAVALGAKKKAICTRYGLVGVFPLDVPVDIQGRPGKEQGMIIALKDLTLLRSCDATIVNLSPYLGPSMDSGSAVELGFMAGLGRPVWGYTNEAKLFGDRVADLVPSGWEVERFGLVDNLMIEGTIDQCGGQVFRPDDTLEFDDLSVFERCVAALADSLKTST
jgi:nucleoside 2-deoxyribosyltransferase